MRDATRGSGGRWWARDSPSRQKRVFKGVGVAHTMGWMSRNKLIKRVFWNRIWGGCGLGDERLQRLSGCMPDGSDVWMDGRDGKERGS